MRYRRDIIFSPTLDGPKRSLKCLPEHPQAAGYTQRQDDGQQSFISSHLTAPRRWRCALTPSASVGLVNSGGAGRRGRHPGERHGSAASVCGRSFSAGRTGHGSQCPKGAAPPPLVSRRIHREAIPCCCRAAKKAAEAVGPPSRSSGFARVYCAQEREQEAPGRAMRQVCSCCVLAKKITAVQRRGAAAILRDCALEVSSDVGAA